MPSAEGVERTTIRRRIPKVAIRVPGGLTTAQKRSRNFAAAILAIYALVMILPLAVAGWDVSHFVVAGDRFVDAGSVPNHIAVRPNSAGYDGQFYYRLAIHPFDVATTTDGVTFDAPAWRMQRIGYPVLVHMATLGIPSLVPYAMVLVNMLGVFVIAFTAKHIQQRHGLPMWMPWAITIWPGFIVTLVHDTTEIAALALLILAIAAYLAGRLLPYALLAAATSLTRETSITIFIGILLYEGWRWAKTREWNALVRLLIVGAAVVPFLIWRQVLIVRLGISPQAEAGGNMSLPFMGIAQTLWDCLAGTRVWAHRPLTNTLDRLVIGTFICVLVGSAICAAAGLSRRLRLGGPFAAVAVGWIVLAVLMTLLSADGPWVDTTACFRAFSEYWLVTMIVVAGSDLRVPGVVALPASVMWGVCVGIVTPDPRRPQHLSRIPRSRGMGREPNGAPSAPRSQTFLVSLVAISYISSGA